MYDLRPLNEDATSAIRYRITRLAGEELPLQVSPWIGLGRNLYVQAFSTQATPGAQDFNRAAGAPNVQRVNGWVTALGSMGTYPNSLTTP